MEAATVTVGGSGRWRAAQLGRALRLLAHLVRRELTAHHRFSLLGVLWPLLRVLAQAAVLTFVFTSVISVGVEDYAVFLLVGLVAWTWFSRSLGRAARSVLKSPQLAFHPGFPLPLLPLVAVVVGLVDVAIALPVVVVATTAIGTLGWTALLLPVLLALQLLLLCGLAWLLAPASVYLRDLPDGVELVLMLLFYATPVIYPLARVPEDWRWLLELNPMAALLDAYRSVLIDGAAPDPVGLAFVAATAAALLGAGLLVFNRLRPGLVDSL